jgi:hypothetical protein
MEIQLEKERFEIWQTFKLITDFGGKQQELQRSCQQCDRGWVQVYTLTGNIF